jgi:uncharacterized protein YkwD
MSAPAARLGAVALAAAVLASVAGACSAPEPPAAQAVGSPTSASTPAVTAETPGTSASAPTTTTAPTPSTTAAPTPSSPATSATPPSRSTARTTPKPTRTPTPTATPAPRPPSTTPPPQTGTDAYENEVLALVNAERTAAGLRPLGAQACPDGFAEPWSPHMAAAGSLSHQSLGPILSACGARTAAENVGMNSAPSPASMVAGFMGSPPHRANILNPAYTGIGIGAYRDARGVWWVTQDFVG